jgi:hypothetical protein
MNISTFMIKNKIAILGIGAVVIVAGVIFIAGASRKSTITTQFTNGNKQITVGNDICTEFPKEWVALSTGKTIIRAVASGTKGIATYPCDYYINETNFISIDVNDYNVETQKKGRIQMGDTLKTDPRIAMEHFIVFEKDGQINSIFLILGPNRFVTVDKFYGKVFDNEGVIAFAARVAERIQKGENHVAGSTSDSNSVPTSAPTLTPAPTIKTTAPLPQETDIVNSFFNLINEHKPSDAVNMLSQSQIGDDSQKQAWAVMFNGFESVNITKVEPSMPEDWTANVHTYRVTLNVKMKPESATATIPYFGYDNGINTRFITLEKAGGLWKVSGISTGP